MYYQRLIRPLLFRFDAEYIHHQTMNLARYSGRNAVLNYLVRRLYYYHSKRLRQERLGISFDNPAGLAAGFDKNGEAVGLFESLGFGYIEIGSITARPSPGNPAPRAFRLPEDHALINRMGLNNLGASIITEKIRQKITDIPVGVNIAKTHDREIMGNRAIEDYLISYRMAAPVADYITLNISCPNTSEGKTFEEPAALDDLLGAISKERTREHPPLFVKLSPDPAPPQIHKLAAICEQHGVDGYVCGNTSCRRDNLETASLRLKQIGRGGLSGPPLSPMVNQLIRTVRQNVPNERIIIGVGGIDSFESALDKFRAGADLIQIFTGLIYEGPGLVKQINRKLDHYLAKRGLTMDELRGHLEGDRPNR